MYWTAHQGHWCGLSWVLGARRNNEEAWRRGWRGAGCSRQCRSRECPQRKAREEAQRAGGQLQQEHTGPDHAGPSRPEATSIHLCPLSPLTSECPCSDNKLRSHLIYGSHYGVCPKINQCSGRPGHCSHLQACCFACRGRGPASPRGCSSYLSWMVCEGPCLAAPGHPAPLPSSRADPAAPMPASPSSVS